MRLLQRFCPACFWAEITGTIVLAGERYYDSGFECWTRQCRVCLAFHEDPNQSGVPEHLNPEKCAMHVGDEQLR